MRIKRAKTKDTRVSTHTTQYQGYEVDDHVLVLSKDGGEKVVKICDIWYNNGKENHFEAFVTAQFYHFSKHLSSTVLKKIPQGTTSNEVFRSNMTSSLSFKTILRKCKVVGKKILATKENSYFCRYHFDPSNLKYPFTKLTDRELYITKEPPFICKPKIGQRFQAEIPSNSMIQSNNQVCDLSQVTWFPEKRVMETTYIVLATCLQLAVGNIVRTWDNEKNCHSICTIKTHNPDGTIDIKFLNGRIENKVSPRSVLGCINEEVAMNILTECEYDTSRALVICANKLVEYQAHQGKLMQKKIEKTEKATIAAIHDTDIKLRRGTRRASLVALQKIFSSA